MKITSKEYLTSFHLDCIINALEETQRVVKRKITKTTKILLCIVLRKKSKQSICQIMIYYLQVPTKVNNKAVNSKGCFFP